MKLKLKSFIPLFVILGGVAAIFVLGALKPTPPEEETKAPVLTVNVVPAEYLEQQVSSNFQGEVRAKTDIELVTQVTGKVVEVSDRFVEGGEFKAGETILRIDDADYRVALKSAEAAVASAKVDVELELGTAATNAKQWEELQGRPVSEASPLTLNKPQVDRAKARLDAANAELSQARLNYQRTFISAPFDGRIISKSAELGQFMARGSSIGRVFATRSMEIRIPMTDIQVAELGLRLGYSASSEGSAVDARIPANVSAVFGVDRQEWLGYLRSVDASIDQQTRLVYATVLVEEPFTNTSQHRVPLVPGLFVDIELDGAEKVAGVQIPRMAIRHGNEVYVEEEGVLRKKAVTVIYTSADFAVADPVKSDVKGGDLVITSPVPGAFNGMTVQTQLTVDTQSLAVPEADEDKESLTDNDSSSVSNENTIETGA